MPDSARQSMVAQSAGTNENCVPWHPGRPQRAENEVRSSRIRSVRMEITEQRANVDYREGTLDDLIPSVPNLRWLEPDRGEAGRLRRRHPASETETAILTKGKSIAHATCTEASC